MSDADLNSNQELKDLVNGVKMTQGELNKAFDKNKIKLSKLKYHKISKIGWIREIWLIRFFQLTLQLVMISITIYMKQSCKSHVQMFQTYLQIKLHSFKRLAMFWKTKFSDHVGSESWQNN